MPKNEPPFFLVPPPPMDQKALDSMIEIARHDRDVRASNERIEAVARELLKQHQSDVESGREIRRWSLRQELRSLELALVSLDLARNRLPPKESA